MISSKYELKRLLRLTKQTDSMYLEKRNIPENYHPTGAFDFTAWKSEFMKAKDAYERLHEDLLYTDEKQIFDDAVDTFEKLNNLFCEIGE